MQEVIKSKDVEQLGSLVRNFNQLKVSEQRTFIIELHTSMMGLVGRTVQEVCYTYLNEFFMEVTALDEYIAKRLTCGLETRYLAKAFEAVVDQWKRGRLLGEP